METVLEEKERDILRRLSEGRTVEQVLALGLAPGDVARAAARGLAALEGACASRPETREERIERLRRTHPRAYAPWTEEEDARLLRRFDEGARMAELAHETGRPPGAVRARLDRWLGPSWRTRGVGDRPRPG